MRPGANSPPSAGKGQGAPTQNLLHGSIQFECWLRAGTAADYRFLIEERAAVSHPLLGFNVFQCELEVVLGCELHPPVSRLGRGCAGC
jgi:hypothetical protein